MIAALRPGRRGVRRAEVHAAAAQGRRLHAGEPAQARTAGCSAPRPSAAAKLDGYLEDYAYLIDAWSSLYEASSTRGGSAKRLELADVMIKQFADPDGRASSSPPTTTSR